MRICWPLLLCLCLFAANVFAQTQGDPTKTEVWTLVPVVVTPGQGMAPPSDAIVLFDGSNLGEWESVKGGPARWALDNGAMTVTPGNGDIRTKRGFGSVQLHIEWRSPEVVKGEGQGRGNSGIFLMDTYEVQVLDSYNNRTYSNGQAASIYKQHIPLANACRPPGEWQHYDIIFEAPVFNADKSLQKPAYLTVFHNGVLVQNHAELRGPTLYIGEPSYQWHPAQLPVRLQDHGDLVSFRNIWLRPL